MSKKELTHRERRALSIGLHLMDSWDDYIKKPRGLRLVVPVIIKQKPVRVELEPEYCYKLTGIWE